MSENQFPRRVQRWELGVRSIRLGTVCLYTLDNGPTLVCRDGTVACVSTKQIVALCQMTALFIKLAQASTHAKTPGSEGKIDEVRGISQSSSVRCLFKVGIGNGRGLGILYTLHCWCKVRDSYFILTR